MPQRKGSSAQQVSICDCYKLIVMTEESHMRCPGSLKYGHEQGLGTSSLWCKLKNISTTCVQCTSAWPFGNFFQNGNLIQKHHINYSIQANVGGHTDAVLQYHQLFGKITRQQHLQSSTQNLAETLDLILRVQCMYPFVIEMTLHMAYDGLPSESSSC